MKSSNIFELFLASCLIILGVYVGFSESLTLPGRVSMNTYYIEPPATFFMAGSIFCFSCMLILLTLNKDKYKKISMGLLISCFVLLTIGIIISIN